MGWKTNQPTKHTNNVVPPYSTKKSLHDSYWRKGYSFMPRYQLIQPKPGLAGSDHTSMVSSIYPKALQSHFFLPKYFFPLNIIFALFLPSLFITLYFSGIERTFYSSANVLSSSYLLLNHVPIKLELATILICHIFKNSINLPFTLSFCIMNKATETPHPTPALGILLFIIALCWQICSPFSISPHLLLVWSKLIF